MFVGLPATDWLPPMLKYYDRYYGKGAFDFLKLLDNKFSAGWIVQDTPTARIEAMNDIIKEIDAHDDYATLLKSSSLLFDVETLLGQLRGKIYGRRFARYVLLKLDFYFQDHSHKMNHEAISVEHILPQEPDLESQWRVDFTEEQRDSMTNTLGNLVLISMRKNSSQGRLDYTAKRERYFRRRISSCPNSQRVLMGNEKWDVAALESNQGECLEIIKFHYTNRH